MIRPLACFAAFAALLASAHAQAPADGGVEVDVVPTDEVTEPASSTPPEASAAPGAPLQPDAPEDEARTSPDPLVTRFETQIEFDRLAAAGDFAAAYQIGARLVELTEQEFGPLSGEAVAAHAAVGRVASKAGDAEAAERHFLRAVEIARAGDGVFSPLAIEPLVGLGDSYQEAGQHLNAISAYGEARTVNRRIYGLLNPAQIPLLDRMTASMESMDRHADAELLQQEALRLIERTYALHSQEALTAMYKYAGWLGENRRHEEERAQYMRAVRVIREHYGQTSAALVRPLTAIGNSFRQQRLPEAQGENALREALALLERQSEPDPLALAEVFRDMGDWAIAFSRAPYQGAEYRRAWQLLGEVEGGEALREAWFTGVQYVLREPISQRGLSTDPDALDGHVLVKFDLSEIGQTANVEVVESVPPGLKDEAVLRHVSRSRFRPQMIDGRIVAGTNLALQFTYRYTLDEQGTR